MEIVYYGGAGEVGRSCICIDGRFLFDSGIKISEEGTEYPCDFDRSRIEAVFVSHAHLDHTGALPAFNHNGLNCPIHCTRMTRDTAKILLKDSLHIELLENQHPGYSKENIWNILSLVETVEYSRTYRLRDAGFRFLDAGHIPGSACVLLEYAGKRILYTGDINTIDTRLIRGSRLSLSDVDVMICEATYGDRNHPERKKTEDAFLSEVTKTLRAAGSVLVPAFAVGRSQEVLMILASRRLSAPVHLDGMAKKVCRLYLRQPQWIRSEARLKDALARTHVIRDWRDRKSCLREQGIFVTTSGMLEGGPAMDYLGALYHDRRSSILMTGFQTEESNGRLLLEEQKAYIDGLRTRVRCRVQKFDFSAHAGRKELLSLIRQLGPRHLVLGHGDIGAIASLGSAVPQKTKVHIARNNEAIQLD